MQQIKKHIAILFIVLLGIIIPQETWHLFTNHIDTSCEFSTGTNLETEHTHCDMLQFETSSYDYHCNSDFKNENNSYYSYIYHKTVFAIRFIDEHISPRGPPLV